MKSPVLKELSYDSDTNPDVSTVFLGGDVSSY